MTASTIAIATAANANAAIAAQQAREAKIIACNGFMPSFRDEGSSSQEKQTYSECVQLFSPAPSMDPGSILAIKAIIVCTLVGLVIGIVVAHKSRLLSSALIDYVMMGLIGAVSGALVPVLLIAIWIGIHFLVVA